MAETKSDIIAGLQKEILSLHGYKPLSNNNTVNIGLGPINHAFPNAVFPLGAIHEFICHSAESATVSSGFIAGILSALMQYCGACIWISSSKKIFPAALNLFGIEPNKIIFVEAEKEKDVLWILEETLKCEGLAAVVGEVRELSFTSSRRFQLAIEQSRVTGFILSNNCHLLNTTASIARWKISPLPSSLPGDMPGVGFPRWRVELLKVRNGKTGSWEVEWVNKSFRHIYQVATIIETQEQRKTG